MTAGQLTAVDVVDFYLARIAAYDDAGPKLNTFIYVNPDARDVAAALDAERMKSGPRGPLHGIPVVIKDNMNTADMPTTAGSLALEGFQPRDDAFQVKKLRDAGAIILGKTNMADFAYSWLTESSLGGQTLSPYDPSRDPTGSSGGSAAAVAANFAMGGFGTDTCGSLRLPAAMNNLYGLRPTAGLSSRSGVIPLSTTLDAVGPMARSVIDLAILLDATAGEDPDDPVTVPGQTSFTDAVDERGLDGRRIGFRALAEGLQPEVYGPFDSTLETLQRSGVELVEVELPETPSRDPFPIFDEFGFALDDFLDARPEAPRRSAAEIIDFYDEHPGIGGVRPPQPVSSLGSAYEDALKRRETYRAAVLELMDDHDLDSIAYPGSTGVPPVAGGPFVDPYDCETAVLAGLPSIVIPSGLTETGLPLGVELLGRPFSEPDLLAMAAGYEAGTNLRALPPHTPPLD